MSDICNLELCESATATVPWNWSGTITINLAGDNTTGADGGVATLSNGNGIVFQSDQESDLDYLVFDFADDADLLEAGGNPWVVNYYPSDTPGVRAECFILDDAPTTCFSFTVIDGLDLPDDISDIELNP